MHFIFHKANHLKKNLFVLVIIFCLTSCGTLPSSSPGPLSDLSVEKTGSPFTEDNKAFWNANTNVIWEKLQPVSLKKLNAAAGQTSNPTEMGWIKLAILSKQDNNTTTLLAQQLMDWRNTYPNHPANSLFPDNGSLTALLHTVPPKHIALLLPLEGPFGTQGQAVRDGFLNAFYTFSAKNTIQPMISFYDTNKNPNILALYQQAVTEGADFIIGPLIKNNVQTLAQTTLPVPTLALNYTEKGFSSSGNLYEFGLSPKDEAQQTADKARQAGLTRAIVIAPSDHWGQGVVKILVTRFEEQGGKISDIFYFTEKSNFTQDIAHLLHVDPTTKNASAAQRRQDMDVIFLIAPPPIARQIVPLLNYYYAGNIPIYATSFIYAGTPSPQKDTDLNGVIFSDIPWVLGYIPEATSTGTMQSNRLFAVGRDAFLLSQNLPRLRQLPAFPLYAATGALTLTQQNQIYRRLPWVRMHDGHP